jgi:hypothetical protein
MTRLEALRDLAEMVEAGNVSYWDLSEGFGISHAIDAELAFRGSLDAAKALHEALLPGWWWSIGTNSVSDDARVAPDFDCPKHGPELREKLPVDVNGFPWEVMTDQFIRQPGNPARAWLLAILWALIEQEEAE